MSELAERELEERQAWVAQKQAAFTARCEECKGTGKVEAHPSFLVDCTACDRRGHLQSVAELLWRNVPSEYRFAALSTLQASEKSSIGAERQGNLINLVKENPDSGWMFCGPPAAGKTVIATALYVRALWKTNPALYEGAARRRYPIPVWRITAKQMLDEHTAYQTANFEDDLDRRLNQPTVTPEKIAYIRRVQLETPRLFLEEIDKVKETESRRNTLFSILDALQADGGQLVITTNLHPEEFAERLGADLWWRIEKMTRVVDLF